MVKKLVIQSLTEEDNTKRSFWLKINYTDIYEVFTQFQEFIKSEYVSRINIFIIYLCNYIITNYFV